MLSKTRNFTTIENKLENKLTRFMVAAILVAQWTTLACKNKAKTGEQAAPDAQVSNGAQSQNGLPKATDRLPNSPYSQATVDTSQLSLSPIITTSQTFQGLPATIPDDTTGLDVFIDVPKHGVMKSMALELFVKHPYPRDLRVSIFHPSGQEVMLRDQIHTPQDGFASAYYNNRPNGYVTPEGYVNTIITNLSQLEGRDIYGRWTVRIKDMDAGGQGTIQAIKLVTYADEWPIAPGAQLTPKIVKLEKTFSSQYISDYSYTDFYFDMTESGVTHDIFINSQFQYDKTADYILIHPDGTAVTVANISHTPFASINSAQNDNLFGPLRGKNALGQWRLRVKSQISSGTLLKLQLMIGINPPSGLFQSAATVPASMTMRIDNGLTNLSDAIPNGYGDITKTFNIAQTGYVDDVGVEFQVNSAYPELLTFYLVHPDGAEKMLFNNQKTPGVATYSYGFPAGTQAADFSKFNGKQTSGAWKIKVKSDYKYLNNPVLLAAKLYVSQRSKWSASTQRLQCSGPRPGFNPGGRGPGSGPSHGPVQPFNPGGGDRPRGPYYPPLPPPVAPTAQCFSDEDCYAGEACIRGQCSSAAACQPVIQCGVCTESGFRTCRAIGCRGEIRTFDERCSAYGGNIQCTSCFYKNDSYHAGGH
jgi:subtilisin-like proprotein convertase family protein